MAAEVGQPAQAFSKPTQTRGERATLEDFRGKKLVLAWHVLDFTGG